MIWSPSPYKHSAAAVGALFSVLRLGPLDAAGLAYVSAVSARACYSEGVRKLVKCGLGATYVDQGMQITEVAWWALLRERRLLNPHVSCCLCQGTAALGGFVTCGRRSRQSTAQLCVHQDASCCRGPCCELARGAGASGGQRARPLSACRRWAANPGSLVGFALRFQRVSLGLKTNM